MKKYFVVIPAKAGIFLVSFLFLVACGTDSRKTEQVNQPAPAPTAEPEIQASNSVNPAKSTLDQEIEKMAADYQRAQVLLEVEKVKDVIKIDVEGDEKNQEEEGKSEGEDESVETETTIEIDRTADASYFVRIINSGATPKLIIDRFYASGKHLTKEIVLKNSVKEGNETIYESAADHDEKIEATDTKIQFKSKSPRYRVVYKDGQWDLRYRETETLAIAGDGDTSLFSEILSLPEVKEEAIDSEKVKQIKLSFSIHAKSVITEPKSVILSPEGEESPSEIPHATRSE